MAAPALAVPRSRGEDQQEEMAERQEQKGVLLVLNARLVGYALKQINILYNNYWPDDVVVSVSDYKPEVMDSIPNEDDICAMSRSSSLFCVRVLTVLFISNVFKLYRFYLVWNQMYPGARFLKSDTRIHLTNSRDSRAYV